MSVRSSLSNLSAAFATFCLPFGGGRAEGGRAPGHSFDSRNSWLKSIALDWGLNSCDPVRMTPEDPPEEAPLCGSQAIGVQDVGGSRRRAGTPEDPLLH